MIEGESAGALWLASRRDSLLLLLLQLGLLAVAWERGPLAALLGALAGAGLFALLLTVARQSDAVPSFSPVTGLRWSWIVVPLGALGPALLVGRAAWLGLGSILLAALLAFLSLSWQLWLYVWSAPGSTASNEES